MAISKNGTILGNGTISHVDVAIGLNDVIVEAIWAPADGGSDALAVGVQLLGQYVSGSATHLL